MCWITRDFILFAALALLGACASHPSPPLSLAQTRVWNFRDLPAVGHFADGRIIALGGFSGLACDPRGPDASGRVRLVTHTDRGPNGDVTGEQRPFFVPTFQPRLVFFDWAASDVALRSSGTLLLRKPRGGAITGLPNLAGRDEVPVDATGKTLGYDPDGLDLEALVYDDDGTFWMGDEYAPSIVHFAHDGREIEREVPRAQAPHRRNRGHASLPAHFAERKMNRGFEAVARSGSQIIGFLQSPIGKAEREVLVVSLDKKSRRVLGEWRLPLVGKGIDKVGDAFALDDGSLLVLEQDGKTGPGAERVVQRVWLEAGGKVRQELVLDLTAAGWSSSEKVEGMVLLDPSHLAFVSDDDFQVAKGVSEFAVLTLTTPLPGRGCASQAQH